MEVALRASDGIWSCVPIAAPSTSDLSDVLLVRRLRVSRPIKICLDHVHDVQTGSSIYCLWLGDGM